MNLEITKLFYNLIPGGVFLSFWIFLFFSSNGLYNGLLNKINSLNDALLVFSYLIISLFLGYFLQAIFKSFKTFCKLDQKISSDKKIDNEEMRSVNAYLWAKGMHELSNYFASYAAFWGNIFIGSIITFLLIIIAGKSFYLFLILTLLISVLSLSWYKMYKGNEFESIINQKKSLETYNKKLA